MANVYVKVDEIGEWRIYDGEEPLGAFLERNRPSKLSDEDTPWICVRNKQKQKQKDDEQDGHAQKDEKLEDEVQLGDEKPLIQIIEAQKQEEYKEEDSKEAKQQDEPQKDEEYEDEYESDEDDDEYESVWTLIRREWTELLKQEHVKKMAHETLRELAIKYKFTAGKWMLFRDSQHIDEPWFTVAKAVMAGKLGWTAKVSTKETIGKSHVICVYNEDFTDDADVRKMLKALRNLGFKSELCYKADIYTILGIYARNNLGISPIIFKSQSGTQMQYHWRDNTWGRKDQKQKQCDWMNDGKESLDSFLERNKPSYINNRDVPWICVRYKHGHDHQDLPLKYNGDDMALIRTEWQEQLKKKAIKMFAAEILKDLAVKHNYTSGKWMIFANREEIDGLWFTVAKAVAAGRLGNEAKVSTNENHVIYVYTQDFTDEGDVRRVEKSLRDSGIRTMMSYKPDIYTALGISAKNELGIPPTVYKSKAYKQWSGYSSRF